jgi:hypothetical protein
MAKDKTNEAASDESPEALKQRIAELEAALKEKNSIPGVSPEIEADVRRRVAAGLELKHAIAAAKSQAENDARIAAEEKAEAEKAAKAAKKKEAQS